MHITDILHTGFRVFRVISVMDAYWVLFSARHWGSVQEGRNQWQVITSLNGLSEWWWLWRLWQVLRVSVWGDQGGQHCDLVLTGLATDRSPRIPGGTGNERQQQQGEIQVLRLWILHLAVPGTHSCKSLSVTRSLYLYILTFLIPLTFMVCLIWY